MVSIQPLRPPSSRAAPSSLSGAISSSTSSSTTTIHDHRPLPPHHQINATATPSTNPALHGASLAFRAPPPPPRPLVNTYSGRNGALAAATRAGGAGMAKEKDRPTTESSSSRTSNHHNRTASNAAATTTITAVMTSGPERGTSYNQRERGPAMQRTASDGFAGEIAARRLTQSPSLLAATRAAAATATTRSTAARTGGAERKNGATAGSARMAKEEDSSDYEQRREQEDPPLMPDAASLVQLFEARDRAAAVRETRPPLQQQQQQRPLSVSASTVKMQMRDLAAPKPRRTVPFQVLEPPPKDRMAMVAATGPVPWNGALEKTLSLTEPSLPLKQHSNTAGAAASSSSSRHLPTTAELSTSNSSSRQAATLVEARTKIPPLIPQARKARPLQKNTSTPSIDINANEQPLQMPRPSSAEQDLESDSDDSYSSARDMLSRTSTLEAAVRKPPPIAPRLKAPDDHISTASLVLYPTTITATAHTNQRVPSPPHRKQTSPRPLSLSGNPPRSTSSRPPLLRPRLSASSLANALVASSLASSRAPSPSPSLSSFASAASAAAAPRRRSLLHIAPSPALFLPPATGSPVRIPSPARPHLLPTLRSPRPSSTTTHNTPSSASTNASTAAAGVPQHRPALLARKHPNKHDEGARRRWRDALTDIERRRYEGVWAANRGGALITAMLDVDEERNRSADPDATTSAPNEPEVAAEAETARREGVQALAVAELWRRSGLADAVLAEVWGLVVGGRVAGSYHHHGGDAGAGGAKTERTSMMMMGRRWLGREEFVVGLWLVDQCLKGRKLPVRVGDSVWESVRGLRGVTVGRMGR